MKGSAVYILTGFLAGLSVYSITGWFFTRKTAAAGTYAVRTVIFIACLAALIMLN